MTRDTTKPIAVEQAERAERVLHHARMLCVEWTAFGRVADDAVQRLRAGKDDRDDRRAMLAGRQIAAREVEVLASQVAAVLYYCGGSQILRAHNPGTPTPPLDVDEFYGRMRVAFNDIESLGRSAALHP